MTSMMIDAPITCHRDARLRVNVRHVRHVVVAVAHVGKIMLLILVIPDVFERVQVELERRLGGALVVLVEPGIESTTTRRVFTALSVNLGQCEASAFVLRSVTVNDRSVILVSARDASATAP